ncbi:adenylate kinase [Candidatus Parcubacteria bacterium]|nr:adenylate kinase [Candidatus Parcubacteria bacterium]
MNIIIFGPQGSGKGTQAKILTDKFNIPHISTGVIFRTHMKKQTKIGKKIATLINNGDLVPDEITNLIIKKRLSKPDTKNGFVLDGYPRDLAQAEYLQTITQLDFALEIWISDIVAVERISQRRICSKCKSIYHLTNKPPKNEQICDICHGDLTTRQDDKPNAVKKRLDLYHAKTESLIKFYKKQNIFHQIDGEKTITQVSEEILKIIK